MEQFVFGYSSEQATTQLVDTCLTQIGPIPKEANFGFIYATDALASELDAVLAELKRHTGIERWAGTVGIGISTTGQEYYEQPALAIMLAEFPEDTFRVFHSASSETDTLSADDNRWLQNDEFHFGILHGDPTNPSTPTLVTQLAERIPGAFFVGGLTSSNGTNPQVANNILTSGISGVVFSSEVSVATAHTQGCTPIADSHIVTSSQNNIAIELDGRPALDVFNEDVGEVIAKDLNRVGGYIFAGLPIPHSDTGDYMVRNLVGIDPDQKLIAIGEPLSEGCKLMFCRRDGNSAREDMMRMLENLKQRLSNDPKGAVYYSCLGRGRHQFGDNSEELKFIRDELGDFPLVGFFANGEIFHNRLYGYTGVLTVFC